MPSISGGYVCHLSPAGKLPSSSIYREAMGQKMSASLRRVLLHKPRPNLRTPRDENRDENTTKENAAIWDRVAYATDH